MAVARKRCARSRAPASLNGGKTRRGDARSPQHRITKRQKVWQNFVTLKAARDSTIHLKSLDQYRRVERVEDLDIGSLCDRFLHDDVSALPKSAVAMIYHFARVTDVLRWMKHPLAVYGVG